MAELQQQQEQQKREPWASADLRKAHARQGSLDVRGGTATAAILTLPTSASSSTSAICPWLPAAAAANRPPKQEVEVEEEKAASPEEAGGAPVPHHHPGGGGGGGVAERTPPPPRPSDQMGTAASPTPGLAGSAEWLMPHAACGSGTGPSSRCPDEAAGVARRQWIAASREWSHSFPTVARDHARRGGGAYSMAAGEEHHHHHHQNPPGDGVEVDGGKEQGSHRRVGLSTSRTLPAKALPLSDSGSEPDSPAFLRPDETESDSSEGSSDTDDDSSSESTSEEEEEREESMSEDTDVDDSEASQLADVKVTFFSIPTPSSISPTTRPFLVRGANGTADALPVGSSPLGSKLQQRKHLRERSLSQRSLSHFSHAGTATNLPSHPLSFAKMAISPSLSAHSLHSDDKHDHREHLHLFPIGDLTSTSRPVLGVSSSSSSSAPSEAGGDLARNAVAVAASSVDDDGDDDKPAITPTVALPQLPIGGELHRDSEIPGGQPQTGSKRSSTDMDAWPAETDFMRTSVDRLFAGESLEREDLERMAAHFSAKWGRRCFSLALNQARAKEEIALLDGPFCDLCALFEAALIASEESADYRCAKHLTHMSLTFYRLLGSGWSDSEVQDFVQNTLQRSGKVHIWRDELFWEEVYYDSVMEEREKVMREAMETPWRAFTSAEQAEIIEKEKNFIFGQLGSYSCTMLSFGVPIERASEFIERHCIINSLTIDQKQMLLNNLDPLVGSFSQEEQEREGKIRKAIWLRKQKEEWAKSREKRLKMRDKPPVRRIYRSTSSIDPSSYALNGPSNADTLLFSKQRSARNLSSQSPSDAKEPRLAAQKPARRKTRIAELFFKPPLSLFSSSPDKPLRGSDDGSPLSPRARGANASSSLSSPRSSPSSPDHAISLEPLSPRSSSSPNASPRLVESITPSNTADKKGSRLWPRKDSPRANARQNASDPQSDLYTSGDECAKPGNALVIATPQSEDELARLQRHNKRLEELIEVYEKQFSVDALAALAYPSLAFAHVPLPHAKAGWLLRLVGRVKKTWRRRLFLLKDDFLLCYASTESACPDHIFRLHKGAPIRSVELYLTAFKEVKKNRDDAAGTADPRPRDQSSCYPYCLEIGITHDPRNGTRGPTGKCLMVSADSEESQRDWFYCLKRAATAKWYRDTTREAPEAAISDEDGTRRPAAVALPT